MAKRRNLSEAQHRAWLGYRRMRLWLDDQIARDLAADSGLSMPDYDVLSTLTSTEDRRGRVVEMAARMHWSKSRLSRHLTRMEQRGLITREESETDYRGAQVVLTGDGLHAITRAAPAHIRSVRTHFIDLLTDAQIAALGDIAETVLTHLAKVAASDGRITKEQEPRLPNLREHLWLDPPPPAEDERREAVTGQDLAGSAAVRPAQRRQRVRGRAGKA